MKNSSATTWCWKYLCERDGRADIYFTTDYISILSLCSSYILTITPKYFFSWLRPCYEICSILPSYARSPNTSIFNHLYTITRIQNYGVCTHLCFLSSKRKTFGFFHRYAITHCSTNSWQLILDRKRKKEKKKKTKQTLFSDFVIFLQSNPRMVITQVH